MFGVAACEYVAACEVGEKKSGPVRFNRHRATDRCGVPSSTTQPVDLQVSLSADCQASFHPLLSRLSDAFYAPFPCRLLPSLPTNPKPPCLSRNLSLHSDFSVVSLVDPRASYGLRRAPSPTCLFPQGPSTLFKTRARLLLLSPLSSHLSIPRAPSLFPVTDWSRESAVVVAKWSSEEEAAVEEGETVEKQTDVEEEAEEESKFADVEASEEA